MSYCSCLRVLKLPSMRYRHRRGDMIEVYKFMTGVYSTDANVIFGKNTRQSRGHELKLVKKRARLDTRKHSFGYRTIDDWNSLPANVVNSSNINTFKNGLDKT